MQVSIIRAAIVFHLCQLINCNHVDSCEKFVYGIKECFFKIPLLSSELKVTYRKNKMTICQLESKRGDTVNDDYTNFPSVTGLWQNSVNDHHSQGFRSYMKLTHVVIEQTRIATFPDHYFCNLPHLTKVVISNNSLSNSRKLGFSSLDKCDIPCSTKVATLFASSNDFEKVFNNSFCGMDQLTYLAMSNSDIYELERDAFINLKSLEFLLLDSNHLSIISPGVFRRQENTLEYLNLGNNRLNGQTLEGLKNLHKLEEIDLRGNRIHAFSEELFDGMSQLKVLLVSNNWIKTLLGPQVNLEHLEELYINQNNISAINDEDLKSMVSLKLIDFSGNPITTVESGAFVNISNLMTITFANSSLSTVPHFIAKMSKLLFLDLSHNRIDRIHEGAFDGGENINSIDLSHNRLTDITGIFTNCTVISLDLNHNQLTKLSFTDFGIKLRRLDMTNNHVHTISSAVNDVGDVAMWQFRGRWHLEYIYLSQNRLNELRHLSLPRSVIMLDVKNNNISVLSYSRSYIRLIYDELFKLRRMDLQNNSFTIIDSGPFVETYKTSMQYLLSGNPLRCSCENDWLARSRDRHESAVFIQSTIADRDQLTCTPVFRRLGNRHPIVNLEDHDFLCVTNSSYFCGTFVKQQSLPKSKCKCLSLSCPHQCVCYSHDPTFVVHFDCSSKSIRNLPVTPISQCSYFRQLYVYLDNNSIYDINYYSLAGLESTNFLYLNQTNLHKMEDGSFDQLNVLSILHLDHNSLRHISEKIFKRLDSLTQLHLSHNQIHMVAFNAFPSQLQTLHLDNNRLVNYNVWQLQNLTNLMKLSLHDNKWSCECNFIESFRNWLQKYSSIVEEANNLFCFQSNGTQSQMPLITFNSSYCYNTASINISLYDYENMWKWLLGMFICLAIISVLVYIFRREVQVLIYSRLGVRLFYSGERDELEGKYFDAFIAYSCVDEDFLVNILMPGLEGIDEPYKLCLHHRNFLGGASIINSIMEAVQFSTRTIILLSDNFMKSEWCRFEFQQAYIQMLKDRCNRLLVIIIDEVPADLDPEMRLYLRTNTYLKWGDRLFWKKLYFAMPERVEPRLAQRRLAQPRVPQDRVIQELPMRVME